MNGASAGESQSSIASNPNNYMSDQALKEDLEVEQSLDSRPLPPPPTAMYTNGTTVPPPGSAAQQVTAEQLMGLDAQGNGGRKGKKSSKQRFEERQVSKRTSLSSTFLPPVIRDVRRADSWYFRLFLSGIAMTRMFARNLLHVPPLQTHRSGSKTG